MLWRDSRSEPESPPSGMSGRILSTDHRCLSRYPARRGVPGQPMMVLLAIPCCSGEPPPRRRRKTSAREQKRNKPRPTGPHWTNQTHRYRAQNATARAQHTAANCGPPFGTKRPQVQILSPRLYSRRSETLTRVGECLSAASTAAKHGQYSNEDEN